MAKNSAAAVLRSGEVVEEVKQTRIIPAEEQNTDNDPRDAFEYMAALPPDEIPEHTAWLYRTAPINQGGYIEKPPIPFDEAWIKERFGGGTYKIIIKRGQERKRIANNVQIFGEPGNAAITTVTNGKAQSDIVAAIDLLIKSNPNAMNAELMKASFLAALDLQKQATAASVMKPSEMMDMVLKMQQMNGGGQPRPSEMPDWLKQVLAAAIPAGVALITKALTPTDAMATLTQVQQVIGVAKTLGTSDAAAPKPDIGVEIIRNAPGLLSEGTKFLAELRAAAQLRIQSEMLARPPHNPAPVVPAVHAAPAMPAAPAAPAVAPGEKPGKPSPEYILGRVCEKIEHGETGGEVLWFIDEYDSAFVDAMKAASMDDLRNFILSSPILGRLKDHPRLETFLKELYDALHEADKAPLPN